MTRRDPIKLLAAAVSGDVSGVEVEVDSELRGGDVIVVSHPDHLWCRKGLRWRF